VFSRQKLSTLIGCTCHHPDISYANSLIDNKML